MLGNHQMMKNQHQILLKTILSERKNLLKRLRVWQLKLLKHRYINLSRNRSQLLRLRLLGRVRKYKAMGRASNRRRRNLNGSKRKCKRKYLCIKTKMNKKKSKIKRGKIKYHKLIKPHEKSLNLSRNQLKEKNRSTNNTKDNQVTNLK